MNEQKLIQISIISEKGDTLLELTPADALAELQRQVHTKGKWLFVDGVHTNVDRIRLEDLDPNSEYMLTNLIKGGCGEMQQRRANTEDPVDTAYDEGYEEGHSDGYEEGHEEGYDEGFDAGYDEARLDYQCDDECCTNDACECTGEQAEFDGWGERVSIPSGNGAYNENRCFNAPPAQSGVTAMNIIFNATPNVPADVEDLAMYINVATETLTCNLRDSVAPSYIRNRELIGNVLEQTLNNLALDEMRNIANKTHSQFDVPNAIVRDFGIVTNFEWIADGDTDASLPDCEVSYSPADNTILVTVNHAHRFEVFARRRYIVAAVRVKLEGLSRHFTEQFRTILGI